MDPFTLALALAALGLVFAAVVISIRKVIEWFKSRGKIKERNAAAVAFTLAERINGHQYAEVGGVFAKSSAQTRIVQGFYDPVTEQVLDARAMSSDKAVEDEDVIRLHNEGDGMVIYT